MDDLAAVTFSGGRDEGTAPATAASSLASEIVSFSGPAEEDQQHKKEENNDAEE